MQLKIELFTLGFFGLETLVMLTIVIYNFFRLLLTRSRKLYLALVGIHNMVGIFFFAPAMKNRKSLTIS